MIYRNLVSVGLRSLPLPLARGPSITIEPFPAIQIAQVFCTVSNRVANKGVWFSTGSTAPVQCRELQQRQGVGGSLYWFGVELGKNVRVPWPYLIMYLWFLLYRRQKFASLESNVNLMKDTPGKSLDDIQMRELRTTWLQGRGAGVS